MTQQVAQFSQQEMALLQNIQGATDSQTGYGYANPNVFVNLQNAQMVESLETERNPNNADECAVRITEAGRSYLQSLNGQAQVTQAAPSVASNAPAASNAAAATPAPTFTLRSDIVVSKRTRVAPPGGKKSRYPFDVMQVGQSFHVKPSDLGDVKDPFKTIASSVSAANRKYSTVTAEPLVDKKTGVQRVSKKGKPMFKSTQERHYTCAKVGGDDPDGEGIRVYRTK